jgi:ubiquitin C-terminal hydrolase
MTAMVASIQPHSFTTDFQEEEETIGGPMRTNDLVVIDRVPSTYGLVDDTDTDDDDMKMQKPTKDDVSTASSSTFPSLNAMDDFALDNEMEDEQNHQQQQVADKFGGLNNLGNTCYLNSALQMVASLDNFRRLIEEQKPEREESELRKLLIDVLDKLSRGETVRPADFKQELDVRTPLFVGYRQQDSHEFLTTLLDLLDEDYKKVEDQTSMEDDAGEETTSQDRFERVTRAQHEEEPTESSHKKQRVEDNTLLSLPASGSFRDLQFADIENLLHGTNSTNTMSAAPMQETMERHEPKYKLVGGRMDTSGITLTKLEEQSFTDGKTNTVKASESDDSCVSKERNPVDSYLTTEVRVCLTCDSCNYRRSHTETYLHLSLEIGPNCSSVEEGLRKFFAPEKRELKCEKCFYETAMQTTEITRLPTAMLLHLKRFIVDVSPDYTSISYRKDQSAVSFEEDLGFEEDGVLSDFLAADVSLPEGDAYAIRSVVNHIGSSASCGHYTADAKLQYSNGHREWTRFNDSYVSKISSQDAIQNSSQTAYMIVYEVQSQQT